MSYWVTLVFISFIAVMSSEMALVAQCATIALGLFCMA